MTKTEAEALLAQASPDGWSDVRTWQSPAGTWAAWIAAGSTATEPTRAHIDTCGVEGHATEGDAVRALVGRIAGFAEGDAASERFEAVRLRAMAHEHEKMAEVYAREAAMLRGAL